MNYSAPTLKLIGMVWRNESERSVTLDAELPGVEVY